MIGYAAIALAYLAWCAAAIVCKDRVEGMLTVDARYPFGTAFTLFWFPLLYWQMTSLRKQPASRDPTFVPASTSPTANRALQASWNAGAMARLRLDGRVAWIVGSIVLPVVAVSFALDIRAQFIRNPAATVVGFLCGIGFTVTAGVCLFALIWAEQRVVNAGRSLALRLRASHPSDTWA